MIFTPSLLVAYENSLRSNMYSDILQSTAVKCKKISSDNVYGTYCVKILAEICNDELIVHTYKYKLKTYIAKASFDKYADYKSVVKQLKKDIKKSIQEQNAIMFGGNTCLRACKNLTLNQLCDWQWLEDRGCIFTTDPICKNRYVCRMVKYACVLNENGEPVDKDIIKEIITER